MKTRFEIRSATTGWLALTAAFLVVSSVGIPEAKAQVSGFYESDNPYVTIDMSALDGGEGGASARSFPSPAVGALDIPGRKPPVSRLYVKPEEPAGTLPAPRKRIAMTPPSQGMSTPPAAPPESTLNVPGKDVPESSAPKMAAAPPPPKPAQTQTAEAAPPKPEPAPAPEPETAESEAPPPATAETAPSQEQPPAPPPPPEGMGAAPAESTQQASLTPSDMSMEPGLAMQVVFEASASKLPDMPRDDLKALVAKIAEKPNLRLQLLAYAGGESLPSSKARRLSLSRALSVRSFLIENGLRSTRIDVRALGNKTTEQPMNRVDINIVER